MLVSGYLLPEISNIENLKIKWHIIKDTYVFSIFVSWFVYDFHENKHPHVLLQ